MLEAVNLLEQLKLSIPDEPETERAEKLKSVKAEDVGNPKANAEISQTILQLDDLGFGIAFIDTQGSLEAMVKDISSAKFINVDFEGINLCKTGKLCLGQFHASGSDLVYVVDFIALKNAFTLFDNGLKRIMESNDIVKVFFDPRNDCDALYNQFDIETKNCICLQVAEVAYRHTIQGFRVGFVLGLEKSLQRYFLGSLPYAIIQQISTIKGRGQNLFVPERGGSYSVFEVRPLNENLLKYCGVDVYYFDLLRSKLFELLSMTVRDQVIVYSNGRLEAHKAEGYNPKGREKTIAPVF